MQTTQTIIFTWKQQPADVFPKSKLTRANGGEPTKENVFCNLRIKKPSRRSKNFFHYNQLIPVRSSTKLIVQKKARKTIIDPRRSYGNFPKSQLDFSCAYTVRHLTSFARLRRASHVWKVSWLFSQISDFVFNLNEHCNSVHIAVSLSVWLWICSVSSSHSYGH